MSDIIARFTSMDPLAILFLAGSLFFFWGLVKIIRDDVDLYGPADTEREPGRPTEEAGPHGEPRRAA